MVAMKTGNLTGAGWYEMIERAVIESYKFTLRLASVYLTVCYGLPADTLEFNKGEKFDEETQHRYFGWCGPVDHFVGCVST